MRRKKKNKRISAIEMIYTERDMANGSHSGTRCIKYFVSNIHLHFIYGVSFVYTSSTQSVWGIDEGQTDANSLDVRQNESIWNFFVQQTKNKGRAFSLAFSHSSVNSICRLQSTWNYHVFMSKLICPFSTEQNWDSFAQLDLPPTPSPPSTALV